MIFKKFLQPKWKHNDPVVRLKALETLSTDMGKNRATIHELALNDSSDKVRVQALELLNDFALWWQASCNDKSDRLKKTADEYIRKGLLGELAFEVDTQLKDDIIERSNKQALLEELAVKDSDDKTRLRLLLRLKKPNLFTSVLADSHASNWLKQEIVKAIDELSLLEKWLKKADETVKPVLQAKIDGIKEAIEKPKHIKNEVALVLAKLNALRDKSDIEEIESKKAQLQLEWETLKESFELLAESELKEFDAKYDKISKSLENILEPMRERWEAEQAKRLDASQKAKFSDEVSKRLEQIEAGLAHAIGELEELDKETFAEPLKAIQQDMQAMNLSEDDKKNFSRWIERLYSKIDKIPQISECMAEALQLIRTLSGMPVPTSTDELKVVYENYVDWQKQWTMNQRRAGLAFPQTISSAYLQLNELWQGVVGPLLEEQERLFGQVRKLLSDLKHLLSAGKYRRAFGLFKKLSLLMEQLTESQQKKVSRDFDNIKSKIEDLADWQQYVATPRKQQLVEEIQALADTPESDPKVQAEKVKFYRQMWNSLGRTGDEVDDELNTLFDQSCERAFEVCRKYYADQERAREDSLNAKLSLCEELETLNGLLEADEKDWQEIESGVARIRKRWKSTGEVDRDKLDEINKRFHAQLDPLLKALKAYYGDNAKAKEQLLDSAQALIEQDDVFDAGNRLKELQKQWKSIGFAGARTDNELWKKFREVNDQVFARRDALKSERSELNRQRIESLQQQLEQVEQEVAKAQLLSEVEKSEQTFKSLLGVIEEESKTVQTRLGAYAKKLEGLIQRQSKVLEKAAKHLKFEALFEQFERASHGEVLSCEAELESQWSDLLKGLHATQDSQLRHDLTLKLEIAHGVESPANDAARRMELQMGLLSDKLSGEAMESQQSLLRDWIAVGLLAEGERELLNRVKKLYL